MKGTKNLIAVSKATLCIGLSLVLGISIIYKKESKYLTTDNNVQLIASSDDNSENAEVVNSKEELKDIIENNDDTEIKFDVTQMDNEMKQIYYKAFDQAYETAKENGDEVGSKQTELQTVNYILSGQQQENLEEEIEKTNENGVLNVSSSKASIHRIARISTVAKVFNAAINVVLFVMGQSSIREIVKSRGKAFAEGFVKRHIKRTIINTCHYFKVAAKAFIIYNIVNSIVKAYLDPGTIIADILDRYDTKPHSGYLEAKW